MTRFGCLVVVFSDSNDLTTFGFLGFLAHKIIAVATVFDDDSVVLGPIYHRYVSKPLQHDILGNLHCDNVENGVVR